MSDSGATPRRVAGPSLWDAVIPLVVLAVLIASSLALFGLDALDGPIQVALVLCCAVAALIAMKNGHQFTAVQEAGQGALSSVTSAIFILLAVGGLIGVWNLSGTIPTLVYYGIQVLSPGWYYAATALICGVVALSIGSSWTTAATIGVGLVGIADADRGLTGDHGRRGDLGCLPGRQDLTALGDHDPHRPAGRRRHLRAHQATGVDLGARVRDRPGRVHDPRHHRPRHRQRPRDRHGPGRAEHHLLHHSRWPCCPWCCSRSSRSARCRRRSRC